MASAQSHYSSGSIIIVSTIDQKIMKRRGQITLSLMGISLFLFLPCVAGYSQSRRSQFTSHERRELRHCKGSVLTFFHNYQMKEFTRLMNLARTQPELLRKYVNVRYGITYVNTMPWILIDKSFTRNKKRIGLLHPSLSLHMGALYHSLGSGMKGSVGHQHFESRLILSLNLNTFRPGIASGENCEYGSRKAIDIFEALMNSSPHRANILNPEFMRVGISRQWHKGYLYNTVTMFSGPKLHDWVLHRNQSQLIVRK